MVKSFVITAVAACLLVPLLPRAAGAQTEELVAPRSRGGQTLEVPEVHLDLGQVYHVTPGQDTQLSLASNAPLQRLLATTSRIVGYVVAPFELADQKKPLLAGAFRLPVTTLRTASPELDEMLHSAPFFDAAGHPEITYRFDRVANVVYQGTADDVFHYRLDLVGELDAKGSHHPLTVPTEVSFWLSSNQTLNRFVGDMVTLRCKLAVAAKDLGWAPPHPSYRLRIAETLEIDLFLLLNTVSPEQPLDPQADRRKFTDELRFVTLLRDLEDVETAYEHGRSYLQRAWSDAPALARMARLTLTEARDTDRDLAFALKAALRAQELDGGRDPQILATLAQVYAARGDAASALEWQQRALALVEDEEKARALGATLERYRRQRERNTDPAPP